MTLWALAGADPGASASEPPKETVVRMHATAVVTADEVTLGDVAELTGETASLVAGWPVAAAPHAGSAGTVDLRHLQSVLSRRGVNLSSWVFRGASRCIVSRPASVVPARSKAGGDPRGPQPARPQRASAPSTRPSSAPAAATDSHAISSGTLEAAIHDLLRGRLANAGGTLSLRFSPASARLLTLAAPDYEFQVANRSERALGVVPLEVSIIEKGKSSQVVQVVCEASLRRPVIVAARNINRGEILQTSDLGAEERTFDRLEEIGLTDAAPLVGQRARGMIRQGQVLSTRDLEPVPLVARNDLVTVSVRRGRLLITAAARAMAEGCHGDTIMLRSEMSKETFWGVVTGPKTVILADTPPAAGVTWAGGSQ